MKILQINAVYGTSSTGRTYMEREQLLVKKGHDVKTAYGNGHNDTENSFRIGSDRDIKLHGLLSRITGLQAYFSKNATKRLLEYMDDYKPDIVHLGNLHGNYINLNMLLQYLAEKDIATVVTLHDCWVMTGKCTHYTMEKCYKWQTGCSHCTQLKKDNISWFFDRTPTTWKDKKNMFLSIPRLGVAGVSDWMTNEAKKSYFKEAKIVRRIYNWIDLDVFYPRDEDIKTTYHIPPNKFIIAVVGSGWKKDTPKTDDLLKLADKIESDCHIVWIGGGINDIESPANITKIDYISDTNELAKIYSCSDVYVHLSREDTFGKVVAEAMACGTPAVVYDSTALPELIGKECGYVVACENVNQIKEKIDVIKKNGKSLYSQSCIDYVRENFEKDKLIEEYINLYNDLLKG